MLRVAGVASVIAENFKEKLDNKAVISAGLIHDLGNMAKIKLDAFPEFAQPLGVSYWEKVLTEFKQKYGSDDYTATYKILKDLGVSETIYDLVQSLEFAKAPSTAQGNNLELKICLYSDSRVSPHGVVSLRDRLEEVKERFIRNKGISEKKFNQIAESLYEIEKQIFAYCKIIPEDITEEKVRPFIEELKYFEIETSKSPAVA
ncbi:hypothetical protein A2715_02915 [Candidatus Woesebacteria bacterium RIFCSPHIGHO2_01_FULL_39_32]|uniref:HD domain-containing protein n=2 Tax=Candidatus Woeseibacteriota TaxID=1752722 RepID=A0A0G0PPD6_9BACT|nr:MAG: hypothetical protein UT61_C0015G0013 [Candidatus Woesebacteria bacterium GW2011_GWA1_39_8]OGM24693.1 MAG: hypothetical protein A2715_02915 [Candidatus Woesebacteria bacterium RIFCSPHIGHO2_01_FULL_39_32]OGM64519.1 MAG: hypothetical protein A2893_05830 [Candidatus Woesebacteria bacterium RIFCSPLOWO2_01_FULL_39_25]